MPQSYRPKKPIRLNRKYRKPKTQRATDFPDWLPAPDADFIAWGNAAERARGEFDALWRKYKPQSDENIARALGVARNVWHYALDRAYPVGLWNGLGDLLAGKSENLEPYIAFLEADLYFFRSGYMKEEVIKGLKRTPLTESQRSRLQAAVLAVIEKGFRREFRDYCQLARRIQTAKWLQEIEARLSSKDTGIALRAKWVLEACRKP